MGRRVEGDEGGGGAVGGGEIGAAAGGALEAIEQRGDARGLEPVEQRRQRQVVEVGQVREGLGRGEVVAQQGGLVDVVGQDAMRRAHATQGARRRAWVKG